MTNEPSLVSRILQAPAALWVVMALPALPMLQELIAGEYKYLMNLSGEFAARFMIVSLMLTPLMMLFPRVRVFRWLLHRRRDIGLAAFFYALLHLIAYLLHEDSFARIVADLPKLHLITGWLAFVIFVVLAVTSTDRLQLLLGPHWKTVQRTVYAAALLVLVHWVGVGHELGGIAVHFAPLVLLEFYRIGWNLRWWRFSFG